MSDLQAGNDFWAGKRVLITGHTGFKGSWLSFWLDEMGADVFGMALAPEGQPNLFDQLGHESEIDHMLGDIRDSDLVAQRVTQVQPDIVFHLAAQPLVLASYEDPMQTWQTNVMGSLHVMQACRALSKTCSKTCALVMVTTDKVYENQEDGRAYKEDAPLGGYDPYSASKAAMEIAISSWRRSFMQNGPVRMASARAGNVIGGGDWAENRITPDIVRALIAGQEISVRNPGAVRPWQHVLEPLWGYITLAERLWTSDDARYQSSFNLGPDMADVRPVQDLVKAALGHWSGTWHETPDAAAPHEAGLLSLDNSRAAEVLGVTPRWGFDQTVGKTISWYHAVQTGGDAPEITRTQIREFMAP